MRVVAAQVVDVQRHQRVVDEALKELMRQIDIEGADHGAGERHVKLKPRSPREIDHHARQGFIERHVRMAVAIDARLVTHRLFERLAERDADVFHRVVRVDVQVTLRMHRDVHHAMPRELVEHVVRKGTPVCRSALPIAIEIDGHGDLRFLGVALDGGGAGCGVFITLIVGRLRRDQKYRRSRPRRSTGFPSRLLSSASISVGVPTEMRSVLAISGCIGEKVAHQNAPCFQSLEHGRRIREAGQDEVRL